MTATLSTVVAAQMKDLDKLILTYPCYIPVSAAAAYLHIKPEALRAAIDQGKCPFGFGWQLGDRPAYKIPAITFIAWLTKGVLSMAS